MLSSSRFVVAVHVLTLLALKAGKGPVCSTELAQSVETNPVVIRRLMSQLEAVGLVRSSSGRAGGFELARPAKQIDLAAIYAAVEDAQFFRFHRKDNELDCPTAKAILTILMPQLQEASLALTERLGRTFLSDIVPTVKSQAFA